jgi:hypothetical protein
MSSHPFPGGARFAFTVLDDTDGARVENVAPIYDLFERLGMRTTKTVWPVHCPEGSPDFHVSQTLDDPDYHGFVLDLHRRGFEITWHGPTMESSLRERVERGMDRFRELFGAYPRIHVNHSFNRDNLYWGAERLDDPILKRLVRRFADVPSDGHRPGTSYWWGDLCSGRIEYARNLTFSGVNTARYNPSMPYRDPRRPLIPWWFSASDAEGVDEFNRLISPANQERLEREGGICIVATHLGKHFVRDGAVNPTTSDLLHRLADRPGWFPAVGELLDWLRERRPDGALPRTEWARMQWAYAARIATTRLHRLRNRILPTPRPTR